jgi:hypothetical protein
MQFTATLGRLCTRAFAENEDKLRTHRNSSRNMTANEIPQFKRPNFIDEVLSHVSRLGSRFRQKTVKKRKKGKRLAHCSRSEVESHEMILGH